MRDDFLFWFTMIILFFTMFFLGGCTKNKMYLNPNIKQNDNVYFS
jgi:hypothetical protein